MAEIIVPDENEFSPEELLNNETVTQLSTHTDSEETVNEMTSANGKKYAVFFNPYKKQDANASGAATSEPEPDYERDNRSVYWPVENKWRQVEPDKKGPIRIDRYQLLTPGRYYKYRLEFFPTDRGVFLFRDKEPDEYSKAVHWVGGDWAVEFDSTNPTIDHVWWRSIET